MEQKPPAYHPNNPAAAGPPPPYSASPPIRFQPHTQTVYMQQQPHSSVVTTQPMMAPVILMAGGNCPACRAGILRNDFTCCGIWIAVLFFPLGILCCFLMMERRCTHCGLTFA
ncbi:membrane protein BRI3 [Procambarus clarkii]|uniref:membrane protein BRI3 n=1 Tax=Procambarus clarkii TaxID=6728 RepID=UPI001E6755FA|nr:brain protein I3-like isoform X3 [Procambarus clarkii]